MVVRYLLITFASREIEKQIQQFFMILCQDDFYFSGFIRVRHKNLHVM